MPCILIDGGEITKQLAERKSGNVRNDAAIYPKMSVLKVLGLAPGLGAGIGLRVSLLTMSVRKVLGLAPGLGAGMGFRVSLLTRR